MDEIVIVGRLEYVKKNDGCYTCEFIPPCILCTWVSREEVNDALNNDHGIIFDRKHHVKMKRKKMEKLCEDESEMNVIVL